MKISIGCDHAGLILKEALIAHLKSLSYEVTDHGAFTSDSVDYPDYAHPVALDIAEQRADAGILICGSANGVCMTANKHAGIRAALCWKNEVAILARQHNDANILCLPARFISEEEGLQMTDTFLHTPFEGGRHTRRVDKINC